MHPDLVKLLEENPMAGPRPVLVKDLAANRKRARKNLQEEKTPRAKSGVLGRLIRERRLLINMQASQQSPDEYERLREKIREKTKELNNHHYAVKLSKKRTIMEAKPLNQSVEMDTELRIEVELDRAKIDKMFADLFKLGEKI